MKEIRLMNRKANLDPISLKNRHVSANTAPFTSWIAHLAPPLFCSAVVLTEHMFLLMTDATTDRGTKKAECSLELFCTSKQKYCSLPH